MNIKKLTPVRIVDRIEPCIAFWCEALGFEKRAEVPHGDALGFALLGRGAVELMFQTSASLLEDIPNAAERKPDTLLYVEVDSLAEVRAATREAAVLVPERTTFYGMRETVMVDPRGTVVIFAEKA
jgi:uncharacterized glyoxalase superfamily protein PhnB